MATTATPGSGTGGATRGHAAVQAARTGKVAPNALSRKRRAAPSLLDPHGGRVGESTLGALRTSSTAVAPSAGRIRLANQAGIVRAAEAVFARDGFRGASMAEIAAQAGVAKANIHYYFRTKQQLYRAVLEGMLHDWLAETDGIREDADPAQALAAYVRAKMALALARPEASRVFAGEMLRGAPEMQTILRGELRELVARKSAVIEGWIAQGRMAPVDPPHLFFSIWAATQTYADFAPQVRAVLGARSLRGAPWQRATEHVVGFVLRGCGLDVPALDAAASAPPRLEARA